jgi:hypothetical protein
MQPHQPDIPRAELALGCERERMPSSDTDLRETISRHERDIADLQAQVKALQDGHAKEQLEAQIARRVAELEADIKLQEMQEAMAKEQTHRRRKRHFPWVK